MHDSEFCSLTAFIKENMNQFAQLTSDVALEPVTALKLFVENSFWVVETDWTTWAGDTSTEFEDVELDE